MVQKGAIVKVDFNAFTADGDLFDTTSKDVAKKHDRFDEETPYGPLAVVVGAGRVVPGFDKALLEAEPGEEKEITIPPEEAFGEKDPDKIETVALREFLKQDVTPHPGMRVTYQNKRGTVTNVTPGRVRIDYNPPLAGKTLKYDFKILEVVEDPVEKVRALVDMAYGIGKSEDFEVKAEGETAELKLPDSCKYDQRWFVAKYRLVSDLRQYAAVKTVRFIEEYVTEEPPVPETPEGEGESAAEAASKPSQ